MKDFYIFKTNFFEVSFYEKINFSNKIIIISSFIIFFFIPFINFTELSLKRIKKKITDKKFIIIVLLSFFCIFFFNFKNGAGGGFVYKFSIIVFKNYYLIYFVFIASILYFYLNNLLNLNNIFIFVILILYNLQYSIYYKYFDPLLFFFIFLFLMKINLNSFNNLNQISKKCFLFYLLFILMNVFKNNFIKVLTV